MGNLRKTLISCFILLNFLAMIRIHLPLDNKYFSTLYRPVDSYLSFFSIYQDWYMFAPNPSSSNGHVTAEVEFDDGTHDTYDFEHSSATNLFKKYAYGEKFRKFVSDGLRKDSNAFMWKDAAKFVLRKLKESNYHKIPLKVHLIRHWNDILHPDVEFRPHLSKTTQYESFRFYTYEVL
jgi:hypothetical protein